MWNKYTPKYAYDLCNIYAMQYLYVMQLCAKHSLKYFRHDMQYLHCMQYLQYVIQYLYIMQYLNDM